MRSYPYWKSWTSQKSTCNIIVKYFLFFLRYHHIRSDLIRKARRRAVLKNGDCNVVQVHIAERGRRFLQDIFTTLVDAQWRWTFLTFVMSFLLSWLAFAMMWWLIAYSHGDFLEENRSNTSWVPCVVNIDGFVSCFLYSIETQHSTGYGSRAPTSECLEALFLLCVQSIIGVMIQVFIWKKICMPMIHIIGWGYPPWLSSFFFFAKCNKCHS